jgi:hypothetical protein
MSSPSVLTQTIDQTHYIPNFTNEVACFAGYFEKGPIDSPVFITSINEFKFIFGRGIDLHHNDWYQVYNYLQYSSGCWVCRTSGAQYGNASNEDSIFINDSFEWQDQRDSIETYGLRFLAQTPGDWGNLISVAVVSFEQWDNNEEVYAGLYAQNLFTYFEPGYVGVCVFRKEKLVERFYKTDETFEEINDESKYIYTKFNQSNDSYIVRLDCNDESIWLILDLNKDLELNFSNDLNENYELLVKKYVELLDCNVGDKISIYNLNINVELPFLNDLNLDPNAEVNKDYYTYYGDNIIRLSGGHANFPTDVDISRSYEIFENKESYDIDIIIGNDKYNNAAVNLAESRKDSIAFIGIPTSFITYLKLHMGEGNPQETAYTQTGLVIAVNETTIPYKVNDLILEEFNNYVASIPNSQYVHFTMNVKEQMDGFTNKYKLVNIAGDTAGLKAQASLTAPWSTGAGLERGFIKNANNMYFTVRNLDTYYKKGLNYVQNNSLMTQKTFYTKASSFNRVNVRSVFNHVEKETQKLLRYYVFEENTYRVRGIIASTIRKYLEDVKSSQGIDAGRVHVHGDGKEILVDIYIKPKYVAEYIQLRMRNIGAETISNYLSNTIA